MKYGFDSWYIRVMHESLQEQSWTHIVNEQRNNGEKSAYGKTKDSDGGYIETKLEWFAGSLYKPGIWEMNGMCVCMCVCLGGWSCPWCGADCV